MDKGFFKVVSRRECEERLRSFAPLQTEVVALPDALGRVLSERVVSNEDLPLVSRSGMDGFAVRAADTFGASEGNPAYLDKVGDIEVDALSGRSLEQGQCMSIVTGGSLPEGADSVVMVEYTLALGPDMVEIRKGVAPGDNVMLKGEDAATGSVVLEAGRRLRTQEIGLLAALGCTDIQVRRRPRVGIISTGDELVEVRQQPRPGQVRDVNTYTVAALVRQGNGQAKAYGIVKDDLGALQNALQTAVDENDVVFLSGGSSVGYRDLTLDAVASLPESEVLVHGVAISPGKPTIVARSEGKCIVGLPGQVASAQVVMLVLGMGLLSHLEGDGAAFDPAGRCRVPAVLSRNVASKQGREDYVRVRLEERGNELPLAHPLLGKSGLLKTLLQADGLMTIPEDREGMEKGAVIPVWRI